MCNIELRSLAKNAKKNSKAFYSYLKKKVSNKVSVGPLKDGDELVSDDARMAGILNSFFCSVFTQENLGELPTPEQLYEGEEPLADVIFDEKDVKKKLENLKPSSAPGPDGVWPRLLQKLAAVFATPLHLIFSKLFQEGNVPSIWKQANVCPIFKKGTKGSPGNYRPVSLTCVICKIMESIIRDQVVIHLAKNRLLRTSQHGFMAGRSTLTNLLEYLEVLTKLLDEGHSVDILYLDFAKAFDKVPHQRLLDKCRGLGVEGNTLAWIKEWLSGRQQRVVLNGEYSDWGEVRSGVPQGSVLGPTLFLMYINDIDLAVDVSGSFLLKFADDTKWAMVVETEEQRRIFQEGIRRLEAWSTEWQMLFNEDKCHILHLGGKNAKFSYSMGGRVLEEVDNEKDLGVIIHSSLKPSMQCARAAGRANQVLGQLGRAVTYRDKKTFLKLYSVYVRPHLEYAVQSWCPYTLEDKAVLEKIQKRSVSMVSNFKSKSYEDKLREAGMITLEARRQRGDMLEMFKIMTKKENVDSSFWFENLEDHRGSGMSTRKSSGLYNVRQHPCNTDLRRNFFSQRVCTTWNSLPDHIKASTSVNMFKNKYDEHFNP